MTAVADEPVVIGTGPQMVQNLGPDVIYVGGPNVDATTGFPIKNGETFAMLYTGTPSYAISVGNSDVRRLPGGSGMYASPAP